MFWGCLLHSNTNLHRTYGVRGAKGKHLAIWGSIPGSATTSLVDLGQFFSPLGGLGVLISKMGTSNDV